MSVTLTGETEWQHCPPTLHVPVNVPPSTVGEEMGDTADRNPWKGSPSTGASSSAAGSEDMGATVDRNPWKGSLPNGASSCATGSVATKAPGDFGQRTRQRTAQQYGWKELFALPAPWSDTDRISLPVGESFANQLVSTSPGHVSSTRIGNAGTEGPSRRFTLHPSLAPWHSKWF